MSAGLQGAIETAPVTRLHERRSYDPADFAVPGGREEEWRFTPLRRLRGRPFLPADGAGSTSDQLLGHIRQWAQTLYHPVGTCAMGTAGTAVVDPQLRVHGIGGGQRGPHQAQTRHQPTNQVSMRKSHAV